MKLKNQIFSIVLLVGVTTFIYSCTYETPLEQPSVATSLVTEITKTTAICSVNLIKGEESNISALGVCWGLTPDPTIADSISTNVTKKGKGSFSCTIVGLTPGVLYYVRAFATNSEGTFYGNCLNFTTIPSPVVEISQTLMTILLPSNYPQTFKITNIGLPGSQMDYHVDDDGVLQGFLDIKNAIDTLESNETAEIIVSIKDGFTKTGFGSIARSTFVLTVHTPTASNFLMTPVSVNVDVQPPQGSGASITFFEPQQTWQAYWFPDGSGMVSTLSFEPVDPNIVTVSGNPITLPVNYKGPYPPSASYIGTFVAQDKTGTTQVRVRANHPDGTFLYYNNWTVKNDFVGLAQ